MADADSWDAESFKQDDPTTKPVLLDKWEGEDEEEDVKDNWDDEEEEASKGEEKKAESNQTNEKNLREINEENEHLQTNNQDELGECLEQSEESSELTPEEERTENLCTEKLQEGSNPETFGASNNATGLDALSPCSKDDFEEFERLLKAKISPYEKSIHYSGFLESLFRDLSLSLESEDLKKINTSITALLSEKQKQEKQQNKGKKKKKGVVPGGGLKAKLKDDLADYGGFDGGYAQDYEDFM